MWSIRRAFFPLLLLLSWTRLSRAGLVVRHPNTTREFTGHTCIHTLIRPNTEDPGDASDRRNGSIAHLGRLSDADVERLCDGKPVEESSLKGKYLVNNAIWRLCKWDVTFPSVPYRANMYMEMVKANGAQGFLRLGVGDPGKPGLEQYPAVSLRTDYGLPVELEKFVWKSYWCSTVSGDPSGQLGSMTGELDGLPVEEWLVDIKRDRSVWEDTLDSPFYFGFFSVVAPLSCLSLAVLCVSLTLQKSKSTAKANKSGGKKKKGGNSAQSTQTLVLWIEAIANFLLATYLFISGQYARTVPCLYAFTFYTFIGGCGMATTFLTAFFWLCLKVSCLQMANMENLVKARSKQVMAGCVFFICLDFFAPAATYHAVPVFEKLQGGLFAVSQFSVAVYFIYEVRTTMAALTQALSASNAMKATNSGKKSQGLSGKLRKVARWLFMSALFMLLYCITALTAVTGVVWEPTVGWPFCWFLLFTSRFGASATQIMAVRVSTGESKAKVAPSTVTASSVTSSAVTSQAESAMDSSTGRSSTNLGTSASSRTQTSTRAAKDSTYTTSHGFDSSKGSSSMRQSP